jgi:hypothetical protein
VPNWIAEANRMGRQEALIINFCCRDMTVLLDVGIVFVKNPKPIFVLEEKGISPESSFWGGEPLEMIR